MSIEAAEPGYIARLPSSCSGTTPAPLPICRPENLLFFPVTQNACGGRAEDHYLPQHIHHAATWPNGKRHIMTSIDPFSDSCHRLPNPAHPSIALKKKKKKPSEPPAGPAAVSQP
ncbi:hypothetical protein GBF38_009271 [Nibea albiflora]|uniref:Uncharacterized protein n=1 Tax=Nibea albiflora TaxID=240163 RepID=A0ACB7EQU9_NIBAL|nr:hypothetical protein GBF38_009271 [Nibea albiflora]